MNNKTLSAILVSIVLLLGIFAPTVFAPQPPVVPTTLVHGSIGLPCRADPATAYDTASGSLIMNVYEPLIDFYRDKSYPPTQQGKIGQFVARLAEVVGPADPVWPEGKAVQVEVVQKTLWNLTYVNQSDPVCTKWVNINQQPKVLEELDMISLEPINQSCPVSSIWEATTGKFYHLYYWVDTNPTHELDPSDHIFLEELSETMEPIPCTERVYHVELKEHVGPLVRLIVRLVGCYYHINSWRDNDPDGQLGPCDVVYMEELLPIPCHPAEPIECTKLAYHVESKEHIPNPECGQDDIIQIVVKRTWYIFKIRQGVPIHPWKYYNGTLAPAANITCVDVEYSFERAMVQDRLYGPTWMLYKPILDAMNGDDMGFDLTTRAGQEEWIELIECAIQQNCTHVWINVCIDFPEAAWFQILAQTWGCIVPKAFAVDHGCWPGTSFNATGYPHAYYWRRWPTLTRSPLDRAPTTAPYPGYPVIDYTLHAEKAPVLRGTGPYKSTTPGGWDTVANLWRIDRFLDYWGGWAPYDCHPYFVDTYIMRNIELWPPRLAAFMAGDIDIIAVPRAYMHVLLQPNGDPIPGVVCYKDVPMYSIESLHFQFTVTAGSDYMPTIGGMNQSDFFSNVHARKAFAYALNFTELIEDAWYGEADQPATPLVDGLVPDFRDPTIPKYDINMTMVENHLKNANFSGVSLWESGFSVTMVHITGDDQGKIACDMIKVEIERLNALRPGKPPFIINVASLTLAGFIADMEAGCLSIFVFKEETITITTEAGNWVSTYMYSKTYFAAIQFYYNPYGDAIIDLIIKTPDVDPTITLTIENTILVNVNSPVCTIWKDASNNKYHLENWIDGWKGTKDGKLSVCDVIALNITDTVGEPSNGWWHVKAMTTAAGKITLELERSVKTDLFVFLQWKFVDECPSLPIVQPRGRAWMRLSKWCILDYSR